MGVEDIIIVPNHSPKEGKISKKSIKIHLVNFYYISLLQKNREIRKIKKPNDFFYFAFLSAGTTGFEIFSTFTGSIGLFILITFLSTTFLSTLG